MNSSPVHDRALLLYGSKRTEALSLAEIEKYGLDSFGDPDYISIYGMPPREWIRRGVRLLGRTAVECTRDALADCIGRDVASVARRMPANQFVVIDPFAGSCNTLFWILGNLSNSKGIAFESDQQVFELTHRNLAVLNLSIELIHGDYLRLLGERRVDKGRGIVTFVAPPWGTALDELEGLDLHRTTPPINEVIDQFSSRFPMHNLLFVVQVYERVREPSLNDIRTQFDWTDLRIYSMNEKGRNHGVILGTKGWVPR